MRRQVVGRSKSFNELFKEQRNEKSFTSAGDNLVYNDSIGSNTITVNEANSYDSAIAITAAGTNAIDEQQQQQNTPVKTPRKNNRKKSATSETLPIPYVCEPAAISSLKQEPYTNHNNSSQLVTNNNNYEPSHSKSLFTQHGNKTNLNQMNNNNTNSLYNALNDQSESASFYQLNQMNMKNDFSHSNFVSNDQQQHQHLTANSSTTPSTGQYYKSNTEQLSSTQNNTMFNTSSLESPFSNRNSNNSNQLFKHSPPPPPPPQLNSNNLTRNLNGLNLNFSSSMLSKHHPRPSAVTSFNARLTDNGGGHTLWNRKQDNLRLILSNAFNQTGGFLDKNRCFTPSGNSNSIETMTESSFVSLKNQSNASREEAGNSLIISQTNFGQQHQPFNHNDESRQKTNEINSIQYGKYINIFYSKWKTL